MLSVKASYLKYGAVRVKAGVMQRNDPHYKMIHGHFSTLRNDPWVIPLRREMTRGSFCNGGHLSALHRHLPLTNVHARTCHCSQKLVEIPFLNKNAKEI